MLTTTMLLLTLSGSPLVAWNDEPPPPPAIERMPGRPGWVWVEGGFQWRRGRYRRLPGHWERERPGRQWHSGRWDWRGDHYEWIPGSWIEGPAYVAPPQYVRNDPPPPPPPQVVQPAPPARPGFVWIPGAHEWRDNHYVWVEGHWEQQRPNDTWNPGHWDRDGDHHAWHAGGWEHGDRERDHDHHHDHDHDHDRDRWRGPALSIAGRVTDPMGRPLAGITIVLAGSSEGRVQTDGDGRYVFNGLAPGSYAVRPTEPRCGFGPDVMNLNNLGASTVQNFTANCR